MESDLQGWEACVVGKLLTKEKIDKEAMYRVLWSLRYTKEWVNFVEVGEGTFLVKFGLVEDRERILNLAPCSISI